MSGRHVLTGFFLAGLVLIALTVFVPSRALAGGADCSADPSTVVVGGLVKITCSGFDPNIFVNAYVVEATGFSEVARPNYAPCLIGVNGDYGSASAKANGSGVAVYNWYTQDGQDTCPGSNDYSGYANQLGTYTVVVQELDGRGGIKYADTVQVTILGNGKTYSGATVWTDGSAVSGGWLTVYGSGFAPNEFVDVWFTRPQDCSGLGDWYYTGVSAFNPSAWDGGGISGASSIKTDGSGSFTATFLLRDHYGNAYPCIGTWYVTANALGSGLGGDAQFTITGNSITETAKVWTDELSVPSIGQPYYGYGAGTGVAVHVNGSGYPAGAQVNCWFTRPDGTVYQGFTESGYNHSSVATVGAGGTFSGLTLTFSSDVGYQGEQPGEWAITCGTPDGKYVGIARFTVYALPFRDP